jgi:hypothetical protein
MENRPIPVSVANEMIAEYTAWLRQQGIDPEKQSQSISFTGKELMSWLSGVMPVADELRICLGVYPKTDPNAGRITVILWPYKDGQPATQPVTDGKDTPPPPPPVDPYNQGSLNP